MARFISLAWLRYCGEENRFSAARTLSVASAHVQADATDRPDFISGQRAQERLHMLLSAGSMPWLKDGAARKDLDFNGLRAVGGQADIKEFVTGLPNERLRRWRRGRHEAH